MAWFLAVLVLASLWFVPLVWIISNYNKNFKIFSEFPGFRPRFLLGHLYDYGLLKFREKSISISALFHIRLGLSSVFHKEGLFVGWMGPWPIVFITRAKTAEVILSSQVLLKKSMLYYPMEDSLGVGLITSSGEKWKQDRKVIAPAFHYRIMGEFLDVMNDHATFLVDVLRQASQEKRWSGLQEGVRNCVLDILIETSLGLRVEAHTESAVYAELVNRTVEMVIERVHSPWFYSKIYYWFPAGCKYLKMKRQGYEIADKLISRRVCEIEENERRGSVTPRKIFVDILLEAEMCQQDMRDHLNTYIVAGYHTVESAICWALYLLGIHKEIQCKVVQEICEIFPGGEVEKIEKNQLSNLKYMDCVIKESLRLYPAIPDMGRQLTEDTVIGGYNIPKGTDCMISISALHRDPDVYPDPERFDPNRFLPENFVGRSPFAYVPFSTGPRNCIGRRYAEMKMKVILSHIISNFTIHSLEPEDKVLVFPEVVARPLEPLKIEFEPRKKSSYIKS